MPPGDIHGEVAAVLYRYAHAYDAGDIDTATACFTPDGVMRVSSRPEPIQGQAALHAFFTAARDGRRDAGTQPRHLVTNVTVVPTDDSQVATTAAYMTLVLVADCHTTIDCTGVYRDRLVATPDGWKFAERLLTFDAAPPR